MSLIPQSKMAKTKQEIEDYVKSKKGNSAGTYKDMWGNERIYFRDKTTGHFTGHIAKTKNSVNAVKRYIPVKVKIKFKLRGKRKKETITYSVYDKKQQKEVLFRMNKKLRNKPSYKREQKEYGLDSRKKRDDAIPYIEGKNKVDLVFDKYKFKPVVIEDFTGESP